MGLKAEDEEVGSSILRPGYEELGGSAAQRPTATPSLMPQRHEPAQSPMRPDSRPPGLPGAHTDFYPTRPNSFEEAGLKPEFVDKLICKYLYPRGAATGRKLAQVLGLPFNLLEGLLRRLKNEMILAYKRTAAVGDYEYVLTDVGYDRGKREMEICAYAGAAPVPLNDYVRSVQAQSFANQQVTSRELRATFSDIVLEDGLLDRLGPAINSGRGMFIYGPPGNGKTTIAQRIATCFGSTIWVPRAIDADGDIVRLYDPVIHEEVRSEEADQPGDAGPDGRWVRIKRPSVLVGGELTMEQLDVRTNKESNISEAALQMKSNCGVLIIDDFGRQRMATRDLLNRWIVPLENRYDFQNLGAGKTIQVPFDQLIVFSTNLEPRELVDEAFLRRIPYKIAVIDPTAHQFRLIWDVVAANFGFELRPAMFDYLLEKHYRQANRSMRSCHPRDLLLQVRSHCRYLDIPVELTEETIDMAVGNYFTVM